MENPCRTILWRFTMYQAPARKKDGSASLGTKVCFKWNQIGSHPRGVQALCDVLKAEDLLSNLSTQNVVPENWTDLESNFRE